MLLEIFNTIVLSAEFCIMDLFLKRLTNLEGIYYLIHSIHNAIIVHLTLDEVINSLADFSYIQNSQKNELAMQYVYALHFYHIALYWRKFRFDDWLHHILMIGIALPIGTLTDSKSLIGYSLFFSTGLPGGIDYFLLFLVRNGWLAKEYEKRVNAWLNTWIRSPGCISHATLTLALVSLERVHFSLDWWLAVSAAGLMYWNGQYFMRQIVENNIKVQLFKNNLEY